MPPQCNGKDPTKTSRNKLSALSFKNLTGAFLLLAVGLSVSLLVFLLEQIYYRFI
jgi:ionotropic glutamate receptor